MKITVFTGNQRRHMGLVKTLAGVAAEVFAVVECTTVFPQHAGGANQISSIMETYFSRVLDSEEKCFYAPSFSPGNARVLPILRGDVSSLPASLLAEALNSDILIVFGASYIKGPLCDALVEKGAINIHMGVSPYYRGSACNFWALYDRRPDMVGATIHMLNSGIDSGAILFHVFPEPAKSDPFEFGMAAVKAAHEALADELAREGGLKFSPSDQNLGEEIRFSRVRDFTDEVAGDYLNDCPTPDEILDRTKMRNLDQFIKPVIWSPD